MYKKIEFQINGTSALLLHNGNLANPTNKIVIEMKKYSSKRKKTETDYDALAKLEWMGSLYLEDGKIVLPGAMLEACIVGGAKKHRRGTDAKVAVFVEDNSQLIYNGPTDIEELWNDEKFRLVAGVVISRSRVMRTRPMFKKWSATVIVTYNADIVNANDVIEWVNTAGQQCGLGDWRPKFGRFEVTSYTEL